MKNKYAVTANRWWLAVVWVMSVALSMQAQTTQPPVIQWQRVVEGNGNVGSVSGRPAIIKNSQGGYSVLTGDRRLLFLTTSGDIMTDTPVTGVFYDRSTTPALSTIGLAPTSDGGVVVGVQDNLAWSLQKRDANGAVGWINRLFAYSDNYFYSVTDVVVSPDGGFMIFATYQDRNFTPGQVFVAANKIDKNGNQVWTKTIRYPGASGTRVSQAISTVDGGYLLAGATYTPADRDTFRGWAAKLDEQGNVTWQNRYDQVNGLNGAALYTADSESYVLNGLSFSNSPAFYAPSSFVVDRLGGVRSNLPAVVVPFAAINSTATVTAVPYTNRPSAYVVANHTPFDTNGGDIRLTTFSNQGDLVWTKTLGGSGRDYGAAPSVLATDNGFVVIGITESTNGDVQGKTNNNPATWIVKLEDPTKRFTLAQPIYNCQTGQISFTWIGGDGSPITYSAPGISRSSATSNSGTVEPGLRNDPKPIIITATQSGETSSYVFDFNAFCNGTQPPVLIKPIPDFTFTVSTGVSDQFVSQYFSTQTSSDDVRFTASGLPLGLSFYELRSLREAYFGGFPRATGVYTVTVTATNSTLTPPNNSVSTTFKITIVDQPVVNPPTPPTGGTLALTQPTYNCQTGAITFNTTGGDGSPITYNAPGIGRANITDNFGTVEPGLRNDPKPITITAVQSGQTASYTFDLKVYCSPQRAKVPLPSYIPNPTFMVNQSLSYPNLVIGSGYYDASDPYNYKTWPISASGLPPGLSLNTGVASGTYFYVGIFGTPTTPGTYPVTVTVVDPRFPNDLPFATSFTITIIGAVPSTLTLTAPTYDCASGAIIFRSSGGNGSSVEYAAAGITGWTTNPNQLVDPDSRTANDVKPFTLMARQNGVTVSYVWDLKAACGRARVGVGEPVAELNVSVLGNPVSEAVTVAIRGAEGQPLSLRLIDGRGRVIENRLVEQAGATEQQRFDLHRQEPGLLLLRVSSGIQTKTVKVVKQ